MRIVVSGGKGKTPGTVEIDAVSAIKVFNDRDTLVALITQDRRGGLFLSQVGDKDFKELAEKYGIKTKVPVVVL